MTGELGTITTSSGVSGSEVTLRDMSGPKVDGMTAWENLNPWVEWRSLHMVAGAVKGKLNAPSPAEWAHFALHHVMVVCSEDTPRPLRKLLEYLKIHTVTATEKEVRPDQVGVTLERISFESGSAFGGPSSDAREALIVPRKGLVLFVGCAPTKGTWGDVCTKQVDAAWFLEALDELYARVDLPTPVTQAIRTKIILGEGC